MIEVKDRIPRKPNRILITPENGEPFYATWERADEPIEEGTPVNKLLFDSIDEGGTVFSGVDDIEIATQDITTDAGGWTYVKFNRPLSGIPRVLTSVRGDGMYVISVRSITASGCEVAVREMVTGTYYASTTSNGGNLSAIVGMKSLSIVSVPISIAAIFDGGAEL